MLLLNLRQGLRNGIRLIVKDIKETFCILQYLRDKRPGKMSSSRASNSYQPLKVYHSNLRESNTRWCPAMLLPSTRRSRIPTITWECAWTLQFLATGNFTWAVRVWPAKAFLCGESFIRTHCQMKFKCLYQECGVPRCFDHTRLAQNKRRARQQSVQNYRFHH
jgi:hypothetical protein